ncbi:hypothetical protein AAG570_012966 [Ranatra chinensis]|uniref:Uncharacterized protein n=1 Tax=Ranatra chinensis TaxID=642074 RepID=A0ABD0YFE4_9HEMI
MENKHTLKPDNRLSGLCPLTLLLSLIYNVIGHCRNFTFVRGLTVSPTVRADCGIETTTDLACVTRKLKEKYGGFRHPAEWSVVKLLRMRRADGGSRSDFTHRADQALRLVKQRIQAGTDTTAIEYEVRFLEKLVKEAIQMELADKLRGHDCILDESESFEVTLTRIDEEEDNYQASKEGRNSGWKTVERRQTRQEVQQEDRKTPPPPLPQQLQ